MAARMRSERRSFAAVSGMRAAVGGEEVRDCFGLRPRNDEGLLRPAVSQ